MPMSNVNFTIQNGGLARKGLSEDITSALLMYSDVMPSGWTSGDVVEVKSIAEAELTYNMTSTNTSKFEWFQISQYFKANPSGILWVSIVDSGATYSFDEILTIQRTSGGKCRRLGIQVFSKILDTADLDLIHAHLVTLYNEEMPMWVSYAPNVFDTDFSALPDLRDGDHSDWINVLIGQDGNATGFQLATERDATVGTIGQFIGLSSANNPNINLGWVGGFDWKQGNENDQILICSSDLPNVIKSQLDTLNDKGYSFLYKKTGLAGTFLNDVPTASTLVNNDYAYITETGTIFKAIRDVRTVLSSYVNQQLSLDPVDGTLSIVDVESIQDDAGDPLEDMITTGTISGKDVFVDDEQDVASTSTVQVVIKILSTVTARWIEVSIGLVSSF